MKWEIYNSLGEKPVRTFELHTDRYYNSCVTKDRQLPSVTSYFCGHYSIYYYWMKCFNYSMHEIGTAFRTESGLNDTIVHTFEWGSFWLLDIIKLWKYPKVLFIIKHLTISYAFVYCCCWLLLQLFSLKEALPRLWLWLWLFQWIG